MDIIIMNQPTQPPLPTPGLGFWGLSEMVFSCLFYLSRIWISLLVPPPTQTFNGLPTPMWYTCSSEYACTKLAWILSTHNLKIVHDFFSWQARRGVVEPSKARPGSHNETLRCPFLYTTHRWSGGWFRCQFKRHPNYRWLSSITQCCCNWMQVYFV